jgi:hypothetical protein
MKMLIVIGPQGSGNHLFGKIFSLHDEVHGWKAALEPDGYFIPHWYEPFNEYWNDPSKITVDIMGGKQYAVTSVSNPYMENFTARVPKLEEFVAALATAGIESELAIIGRDRNILDLQQRRLRGGPTWGMMQIMLNRLEEPPLFISQELLYLYRQHYVRSLGKLLNFPVAWRDPRVEEILSEDANAKYIQPCEPTPLDAHVKNFIKPPWLKIQ